MSRKTQPRWIEFVVDTLVGTFVAVPLIVAVGLFWAAVGYVAWNDVVVPMFAAPSVSWATLIVGGIAVSLGHDFANFARRIDALEKR